MYNETVGIFFKKLYNSPEGVGKKIVYFFSPPLANGGLKMGAKNDGVYVVTPSGMLPCYLNQCKRINFAFIPAREIQRQE